MKMYVVQTPRGARTIEADSAVVRNGDLIFTTGGHDTHGFPAGLYLEWGVAKSTDEETGPQLLTEG